MGTLMCQSCRVREETNEKFKRTILDNGGGWGRVKEIGKCLRCDYSYAVFFHAYSLHDRDDAAYMNYFMTSQLPRIIEEHSEWINKEV